VVVVTETDGMDESGGTSREADKITQLEARTRAYGHRKRIYLECTVSTEEGRTWREYQQGTASRIVLFCPHCGDWVSLEREHLVGWKEAATQKEASVTATFVCPSCHEAWNEDERIAANRDSRLLHSGQSLDEEHNVTGPLPPTDTLGFRWSAVNNLFLSAGVLAADEWRASRSPDEENAEREMRQFVWCLPVAPSKLDQTALDTMALAGRMGAWQRGIVPADCQHLTLGVDLGKYLVHWVAVAWAGGATGHVIDYGRIEVASGDLGVEKALMVALRELRDMATTGWPQATSMDANEPLGDKSDIFVPDQVWIDAGYMTEVVYAFCRESRRPYYPCVGRGADQQRRQWYNRPTSTGSVVKHVGEGFHINWLATEKLHLVEIDTDHWKTWLHQRLAAPLERSGTITFHRASPNEHLTLAKHLTAETKTEEFVAGKGVVVKWERIRRTNHWLDALGYTCAAASFAGVRLIDEERRQREAPPPKPRETRPFGIQRPDGGPWIDFDRWGEMQRRYFG
jgi:phage terminase large subunit GpA-like protein